MLAIYIHVMLPWLKILGEKLVSLFESFGKTMQILVLKRMHVKARVNVFEVNDKP